MGAEDCEQSVLWWHEMRFPQVGMRNIISNCCQKFHSGEDTNDNNNISATGQGVEEAKNTNKDKNI